jgi:transcriptional regulator with XRE-family HTH domain
MTVDTTEVAQRFGRALRMVRAGRGLSQEDLGLEAGLSRTFVGDVERGRRCPSLCSVAALAAALGLQPYELVKAADDMAPWVGPGRRA